MAKKIPVNSWITRTRPKRLPKFHHIDKLTGDGKSIKVPFKIFKRGWDLRKRLIINFKC